MNASEEVYGYELKERLEAASEHQNPWPIQAELWRRLLAQQDRIEGKVDAIATALLELGKGLIARGSL